jgi:hypothetical protein
MASSNTALQVTGIDFTTIKNNLKTFLKSQSEFTDYDFDGSGMSVLLDLLAYNTYYNGFYLNMAANESFLDTAQVRKNILSLAKTINYVPMSAQGSLSKVNIVVTPGVLDSNTTAITVNKYSTLLGRDKDGINYPFVTINANTAYLANGTFVLPNVFIKQGEVITRQYIMTPENTSRRFEIPSANVDVTTLVVTVQESASNTKTTEYFLAEDLTEVKANSKVYFLEENDRLNYTIQFGDNVLGQKPSNDSIVIATYLDTVGSIANNISQFNFTDSIRGISSGTIIVNTVQTSYGGTDKETLEQIRFRAPYAYTAQNRAVTKNDYESLVVRDYNNIEAVSVWGGEENDPVVYGKVFMSIKTKGYYALTQIEQDQIKNDLIKSRNVITVIPEIVEPDYVYVLLRGRITYNVNISTKTEDQLLQIIRQAIISYSENELNTFKSTFRMSRLQYYIDSADPSITGSDITAFLQKQVDIFPNETLNYDIKFNAPLTKGGLRDKLYSFPEMTVLDSNEIQRKVLIEETPQSFSGIAAIEITNAGSDYTATPIVTITGDGQGATAVAKVVNGRVIGAEITNRGYEYTQATVAITGGGGSGASATATVDTSFGNLRTYYYKDSGEKVIVNGNIGMIDYINGKIYLESFSAINVIPNTTYANNVVTINAVPEDEIITPLRNRILTIDPNDAKSIIIELVKET